MSMKIMQSLAKRFINHVEGGEVPIPKEWIHQQESLKRLLILRNTEDWQYRPKNPGHKQITWRVRDVTHRQNWVSYLLHVVLELVYKLRQLLFSAPFENSDTCHHIPDVKYVGGFDISYNKENAKEAFVGFSVIDADSLKQVYTNCTYVNVDLPYIAGYLGFREVDFFIKEWEMLKANFPQFIPQVIIVDGNGVLHPQRFGAACHLGVLLDVPTIGVAKNLFCIEGLERNKMHEMLISRLERKGDYFLLFSESRSDILGAALKTCENAKKPVYVSIGHRCTLETALVIVTLCSIYRVPEPIRFADAATRQSLRKQCGVSSVSNKEQDSEEIES